MNEEYHISSIGTQAILQEILRMQWRADGDVIISRQTISPEALESYLEPLGQLGVVAIGIDSKDSGYGEQHLLLDAKQARDILNIRASTLMLPASQVRRAVQDMNAKLHAGLTHIEWKRGRDKISSINAYPKNVADSYIGAFASLGLDAEALPDHDKKEKGLYRVYLKAEHARLYTEDIGLHPTALGPHIDEKSFVRALTDPDHVLLDEMKISVDKKKDRTR